jgi:hypothetical protein
MTPPAGVTETCHVAGEATQVPDLIAPKATTPAQGTRGGRATYPAPIGRMTPTPSPGGLPGTQDP